MKKMYFLVDSIVIILYILFDISKKYIDYSEFIVDCVFFVFSFISIIRFVIILRSIKNQADNQERVKTGDDSMIEP